MRPLNQKYDKANRTKPEDNIILSKQKHNIIKGLKTPARTNLLKMCQKPFKINQIPFFCCFIVIFPVVILYLTSNNIIVSLGIFARFGACAGMFNSIVFLVLFVGSCPSIKTLKNGERSKVGLFCF